MKCEGEEVEEDGVEGVEGWVCEAVEWKGE